MKETYYGFNGWDLIKLGDFDDISEALEKADETDHHFFYVTTLDEWTNVAKRIKQIQDSSQ
jgi:hypothetical protein